MGKGDLLAEESKVQVVSIKESGCSSSKQPLFSFRKKAYLYFCAMLMANVTFSVIKFQSLLAITSLGVS